MCSIGLPSITLYTDANFQGCSREFTGPSYNLCCFNDKVSSVVVKAGLWILYEHCNLGGKIYVVWEGQKVNLPCGVNDTISSLKPIYFDFNETPSCTVFQHCNFGGRNHCLNGPVANLSDLCFNDTISSVKVCSGAWVGYEHGNYKGKQYLFLRGCHNMSASEGCFENDKISSMAPVSLSTNPCYC